VILLGDLSIAGPTAPGDRPRPRLQQERKVRILAGNHEEIVRRELPAQGRAAALPALRRTGTLLAYGIQQGAATKRSSPALQELMGKRMSRLKTSTSSKPFEELIVVGDYAFVHAGIAPQVALKHQQGPDLRWIREPFLSHEKASTRISSSTATRSSTARCPPNRIGIDTGAFNTGR